LRKRKFLLYTSLGFRASGCGVRKGHPHDPECELEEDARLDAEWEAEMHRDVITDDIKFECERQDKEWPAVRVEIGEDRERQHWIETAAYAVRCIEELDRRVGEKPGSVR
jgi:hypothetical protein